MSINKLLIAMTLGLALTACSKQEQAADAAKQHGVRRDETRDGADAEHDDERHECIGHGSAQPGDESHQPTVADRPAKAE